MAGNTVNIKLQLTSEGMDSAQKQAEAINSNLQSAGAAAKALGSTLGSVGRAGTPTPGEGTISNSPSSRRAARAPSSAAAPPSSPTISALTRATEPMGGIDVEDYNRARGAAGAAGGTARDFADQARGLGGLVRLYATFAANIFAATAAFNALSRAMDTSNLVKGLDQLGAAGGRNLGTMSKQIVALTGGAINLREAMEATAKASSAGLSNRQIEQLAEGARKASQALGINMPDALNRLTRGVSKLEPELLDELGIYVKIDDAVTTYARSVGKAASSLSDFERRQAFAVATTTQLQQKFGNIDLDVNPYTKLSASLQNLLQTGLELINKVLGPIAKYLSESPTALATVIGLIGITLLKQVMPVLGQFREGLKRSAQEAAASAKRIQESFGDEFQKRLEARFSLPNLQAELKKTEQQIARLSKPAVPLQAAPERLQSMPKFSSAIADEKSIAALQKLQDTRERYVATGMEGNKKLSAQQVEAYKQEVAAINAKKTALQQELQLHDLKIQKLRQEAALTAAQTAAQALADQPVGMFDPERVAQRRLEIANSRRLRAEAISNAAESANIVGIRASWTLLNKEIADKGINGLNKYFTLAQGGLAAIGSRLMGLISIAGMWGMIIGAAFAVWEGADALFSKNKKQAQETSEALDKLRDSTEFVDKIFDDLSKKDPLARVSTEALNAKATGFREVTDALETALQKAAKQIESANWWDKLKDKVKGVFGQDIATQTGKQFIAGVAKSFELLGEGTERQRQAVEKFKKEFGIDPRSVKDFEKVLINDPTIFNNELAPKMQARLKETGVEFSKTGASSSSLKTNLEAASKILKDFVTSALPTDPVSKFGAELLKIADNLAEALQAPESTLASIVDIAKSSDFQAVLGETGQLFTKNAKAYLDAANDLSTYNEEVRKTNIELKRLQEQRDALQPMANAAVQNLSNRTGVYNEERGKKLRAEGERAQSPRLKELDDQIQAVFTKQKQLTERYIQATGTMTQAAGKTLEDATKNLGKTGEEAIQRGTKYLQLGVAVSFQKAAAVLSSAFTDRLGDSEAGIQRRLEIEKASNNLQIAQLTTQRDLLGAQTQVLDVQERLIIALDLLRLQQKADKTDEEKLQQIRLQARSEGKILPGDTEGKNAELKKRGQQATLDAAKANLDAQIKEFKNKNTAAEIKAQDQIGELKLKKAQEERQLEAERTKTALGRLTFNTKELAYLSQALLLEKQRLEEQELQRLETQEISKLAAERAKQDDTITRLQEKARKGGLNKEEVADLAAANKKLGELRREADLQAETALERRRQAQTKADTDKLDNTLKQRNFDLETVSIVRTANEKARAAYESMAETRNQMASEELEFAKKFGLITEQQYVREKARFDLEKQRREYAQGTRALEQAQQSELQPIQQAQQKLGTRENLVTTVQTGTGVDAEVAAAALEQYDKLQQRIDAINASYAAQKAALDLLNESRTRSIELMLREQEVAAKIADTWGKLAESFNALGDTGKRIGDALLGVGTALEQGAARRLTLDENYAKQSLDIEKNRGDALKDLQENWVGDEEDLRQAKQAVNRRYDSIQLKADKKYANDSIKLEMDRVGSIAGAAKGLFKEKTFAYKALAAIEKGLHIAKIAMMIKEMLFDKAKTAEDVVNTGTRISAAVAEAGVKGTAAVVNQGNGDPYTAFTRMAIMGGIIAALLSTIGGSSKAPTIQAGNTAADRQETQGTGMEWRDGKKVETGRGVFGDPEAKSESISKSIDRLKEAGIEGLSYDSKILKTLQNIEEAIGGAAKSLYTVAGVRTGSMFNTQEGSRSSGGILGLFSNKTSTTITDSGIKLTGSFAQLSGAVSGGTAEFYETVQTTTKKWYGRTRTSVATNVRQSDDLLDLFAGIFSNATDLFVEIGGKLGRSEADIMSVLGSLDASVTASLRGLKGEELEKELESIISTKLDDATRALFGTITDKYQEFGEGALETVIRVIDQMEKVDVAMKAIGRESITDMVRRTMGTETVTQSRGLLGRITGTPTRTYTRTLSEEEIKLKAIEISDNLVKLAGGLEEFLESIESFRENFLTERERIEDVAQGLAEQLGTESTQKLLKDFGVTSIRSRADFKNIIDSIDLTTTAGQQLFSTLMGLQDEILQVIEFEEQLAKARQDQRVAILNLLGDEESRKAATNIQRQQQLQDLDETLRPGQIYLWALQDEQDIKKDLLNLYEKQNSELKKTIDGTKGLIKTLQDYRSQLLGGNLTTLNPMQIYMQRRSEFDDIVARARAGDQDAIAKLPQASTALLEASRTVFASGSDYRNIFDSVVAILDEQGVSLQSQLSDAEKQLAESEKQTDYLKGIKDDGLTTAQQITALTTAYTAAQTKTGMAGLDYDYFMTYTLPDLLDIVNDPLPSTIPGLDQNVTATQEVAAAVNSLATQQATETVAMMAAAAINSDALGTRLINWFSSNRRINIEPMAE